MPDAEMDRADLIIANGFDRYHLLTAASEADRHGRLAMCMVGFYPTSRLCGWLARLGLAERKRVLRLMDRRVMLADERIRAMPVLEGLGHLGACLLGDRATRAVRFGFARKARTLIEARPARLYHYRSGFGHGSAAAARRLGMATLCDHSIAHPAVLAHLVEHGGRLPAPGRCGRIDPLWLDIMDDFRHADRMLVNSDFVKETFVHQGWDPDRIEVIYQGLDDGFFDLLAARPPRTTHSDVDAPLRLAFAGAFEQRKGADHLAETLGALDHLPWTLDLIGPLDDAMKTRHQPLLADPRVRVIGRVSRRELAARLAAADVFLFPSLAEGSARVVFEALAAGCYVVTTPNSGSVVEDGVHGAVVPPDDPAKTVEALERAHGDRPRIALIGQRNAAQMRDHYRQSDYGEALFAVYDRLLTAKGCADQREAA